MKEKLQKLEHRCLKLVATESEYNSYLGGMPTANSSFEWPRKNGLPLGFVAQLDLAEINQDQTVKWLPSSGVLMFFYDLEEWPWGFDPKDKGGWAVAYESNTSFSHTLNPPKDLKKEHIAPAKKHVRSETFASYPDSQRVDLQEFGLGEGDYDEYWDFIDELYGEEPRHQIGGFPSPVQNDSMEEECQLVSNGVYCGDSEGYRSEKANELRQLENDWVLLFQFDSDDDIDAMWGDCGMLYYWIRESDAMRLEFGNSWLILQCS